MAGDDSDEFWDDSQKEWLEDTLNDALKQKLPVIYVTHAPFWKDIALRDAGLNWNSVDDYRVQDDYGNIHTQMDAVNLFRTLLIMEGHLFVG